MSVTAPSGAAGTLTLDSSNSKKMLRALSCPSTSDPKQKQQKHLSGRREHGWVSVTTARCASGFQRRMNAKGEINSRIAIYS